MLHHESLLHLTIGLFEIVCLIFQVSIFVFFFFFGNYFHCLNFICRIYLVFVIRSSSAFSEFMRFDYLFVLLVSHLIEAMWRKKLFIPVDEISSTCWLLVWPNLSLGDDTMDLLLVKAFCESKKYIGLTSQFKMIMQNLFMKMKQCVSTSFPISWGEQWKYNHMNNTDTVGISHFADLVKDEFETSTWPILHQRHLCSHNICYSWTQ